MSALPPFRLETFFSTWEFTARHHMTASDAESVSLPDLLAMAGPADRAAFETLWLGYTQTWGAPDLREAIAETYVACEASDVLCCAGAEEGIFIALNTLLEASDHAIVLTPTYQSLETIAASVCAVSGVALDPDDDWSLDIDAVKRAMRPNTRAVAINFPNNPTGTILARDRFDALVDLCRSRGIWLFSDEAYRPLGPTGAIHLPQVADVYERGISLGVLSKAYGLPGLRIGWLACADRAMLQRFEQAKHYLSISNSGPSERLAVIALRARDTLLGRNCGLVSRNLERLDGFFAERRDLFDWRRPDGGCVAFPRYRGADGVEVFVRRMLDEAGVLLLPASLFRSELGPTPQDRFRIGFGREGLETGLAAFTQQLDRPRP
jgi:aspartate/methionine/tyrosine aminotransferase